MFFPLHLFPLEPFQMSVSVFTTILNFKAFLSFSICFQLHFTMSIEYPFTYISTPQSHINPNLTTLMILVLHFAISCPLREISVANLCVLRPLLKSHPKQCYTTLARVHESIVCSAPWKGKHRQIRKGIKILGIKSRSLSLQFRTLYPGNWRLTFNSSL